MANKTLSMQKVRDIIQLSVKGYSYRQISKITGIHRTIVSNYIRCVEKSEGGLEGSLDLTDQEFLLILKREDEQVPSSQKQLWLSNFFIYARQELQKKHVTRQLLYGEYVDKYPESYSYSQFCELLNRSLKKEEYSLFQTYHPGEIMIADFAGDKLFYIDNETGEEIRCEVLVITLGYSGYTFVIALPNQTQESFIEGLNYALIFFGGSVKIILFDNLKAGVVKSDPYEPSFNALMDMFCRHYDLVPQATRVAKPKDKAQVESHVNIIYKRIYGPLRNRTFFSIAELNAAISEFLVGHNNKKYRGTSKSRSDFYQEEKQNLRPLPSSLFKRKYVKKATAQKNYHVWLGNDEHYYSFPFRYVGKEVSLIYDTSTVEIYCEYERIAVHQRKNKIGRYSTLPEHMPDNHIAVKNGIDPEYLKRQASIIGEYVLEFATRLLDKGLLTPQHFKSCRGVLSLTKKYSKERVNNACKRALLYNSITYKSVEGILQKNLDSFHEDQPPSIPHNPNTRGQLSFI